MDKEVIRKIYELYNLLEHKLKLLEKQKGDLASEWARLRIKEKHLEEWERDLIRREAKMRGGNHAFGS